MSADAEERGGVTVCAVVLTYNRLDLLTQCLDRVDAQSRAPDDILVVDNASTDGTGEVLASRDGIQVLRLPENVGSAGGFRRGLQSAHERAYDWIWLLDDDTMPEATCLEALLAGARRAPKTPSVVASVVRWKDWSLHPMNRPWLRLNRRAEFAEAAGAGLALIRTATFVSTLVHRDALARHGFPAARYFVWLDDMEYFGRLLRGGAGYMVPESTALHWTPRAYDTLTDTRDRFYFKARNHLWLLRGESFGGLERIGYGLSYLRAIRTYLARSPDRREALRTVARGVRDGLR